MLQRIRAKEKRRVVKKGEVVGASFLMLLYCFYYDWGPAGRPICGQNIPM